jgi:hypothetical protein
MFKEFFSKKHEDFVFYDAIESVSTPEDNFEQAQKKFNEALNLFLINTYRQDDDKYLSVT